MEQARDGLHFNKDCLNHRRGGYPIQSVGISYGGGSKVSTLTFSHILPW